MSSCRYGTGRQPGRQHGSGWLFSCQPGKGCFYSADGTVWDDNPVVGTVQDDKMVGGRVWNGNTVAGTVGGDNPVAVRLRYGNPVQGMEWNGMVDQLPARYETILLLPARCGMVK